MLFANISYVGLQETMMLLTAAELKEPTYAAS